MAMPSVVPSLCCLIPESKFGFVVNVVDLDEDELEAVGD